MHSFFRIQSSGSKHSFCQMSDDVLIKGVSRRLDESCSIRTQIHTYLCSLICALNGKRNGRRWSGPVQAFGEVSKSASFANNCYLVYRADAVTVDQKSLPLESCLKCFGCCCADFENLYDILVPGEQGTYRYALYLCLCWSLTRT